MPTTRQAVLDHPSAQDCSLYRPDPHDAEAEELDLGDARVVFLGPFQAPQDWDALQREEYFAEEDPDAFFVARIACLAEAGSKGHFGAEAGDYLAAQPEPGQVQMYYIYEQLDDGSYVVIRDDEEL